MEHAEWIWAAVAFGSGLLFGEIAGRLARRAMTRRGVAAREHAGAVGSFIFWASTAVGLVVAIALIDTTVLDDLGERLGDSLPQFLVAFLLVIAGYALSVAVSAMVGQSARKATGVRQLALERVLRGVILGAAVVLALTELGVPSSMLVVAIALVIGTPCLTFALLSASGGRDVAGQIAAGRSVRHQLRVGQHLVVDGVEGTIVALHPSLVELEQLDGSTVMVPNRRLFDGPFRLRD